MRRNLVLLMLFSALTFAVAGAQDGPWNASTPYKVTRISEGVLFQGHISLDSGLHKETLLAKGACAIARGKYVSRPRIDDEIYNVGEQSAHVFGADGDADAGTDFVNKLVAMEDKQAGDAYCLIQRRVETGCAFGTCATARQFDVYLSSYDRNARRLGSGTDICGGSVFRGIGECMPVVSGGGTAVAGLAVCVETEADLKAGGKQNASLVFAHGIVPKQVAAQAGNATSRQDISCAARGFTGESGPQGAPVAVSTGSSGSSAAAPSGEAGAPATQATRSRWRLRLPRMPKQPKTSVVDEFSD
jgi:hypothetical protein